jgi:hypothetical protein
MCRRAPERNVEPVLFRIFSWAQFGRLLADKPQRATMADDNNDKKEDYDKEDDDRLPYSSRLQSYAPELKIKLHYRDENGVDQIKEFDHYGLIMACLSKFFDAALAAPMAERTTRVVDLHGFSPSIVKEALEYVLAPLYHSPIEQQRIMNCATAVALLPFYDMYDFPTGRVLCDEAIAREFELLENDDDDNSFVAHWEVWKRKTRQDPMSLLLDIAILADDVQLSKASQTTKRYLNLHMATFSQSYHYPDIQALHPMLKRGHFLDVLMPAVFEPHVIMSDGLPMAFFGALSSPCKSCWQYRIQTRDTCIRVEGAGVARVNGLYRPTQSWGSNENGYGWMYIQVREDGTKIFFTYKPLPTPKCYLTELKPDPERSWRRIYQAQVPETRCGYCRMFPPIGSDQWSAVGNNGVLPLPQLSFVVRNDNENNTE